MEEKGIDLSSARPKMLTNETMEEADLVVTMGCTVQDVCPAPLVAQMRKKLVDWHLDDPKGKPIQEVRRIRNEIERKVIELSNSPRESRKMFTRYSVDEPLQGG